MALLGLFTARQNDAAPVSAYFAEMIEGYSIEVMPRTASKIDDLKGLLPAGTRVYVAHIAGTPIDDMVATARRLTDDGFTPMPHIPARNIANVPTLENWLRRYRDEAGVGQALLLGGGQAEPVGELHSSIQLLESGLFDRYGFRRLHVAGHPEGHPGIDADGTTHLVDDALLTKQAYADRTDADMAIVTQFCFAAKPVIAWAERIAAAGITLPIHLGVAGPTKLQTLMKFAITCGVGPSLAVLQKRALDLGKLLLPFEPYDFINEIATYRANRPGSLIAQIHVFPLGGIRQSADWMNERLAADVDG
ncbi:MAG: methylenetetrahydrofolate reductase [Neorhizobium sp.]|nr:methylenetetrahydrofolate reductase [Neorhizobium sp.]